MSEWIQVSERLPEENQHCYVSDGKEVKTAWYGKRTSRDSVGFRFTTINNITHWMPYSLPAPPDVPPTTATIPITTLRRWQQQLSHIVRPEVSEV